MLLEAGRDTSAMFFLDTRLAALRETHVQRVLAGEAPPEDFWERGESAVVQEVKGRFYASHVQEAVGAKGNFDAHSQKLVERAIWLAHEKIKCIPFVGHPDYGDDG